MTRDRAREGGLRGVLVRLRDARPGRRRPLDRPENAPRWHPGPALRSLPGRAVTRWRRSLQVRVVATTVLLSVTVVALLGVFLMQQVRDGLLSSKEEAARTELEAARSTAQRRIDAELPPVADPNAVKTLLNGIAGNLADRAGDAGLYNVVLLDTSGDRSGYISFELQVDTIPQRLRDVVATKQRVAYTFVEVRYFDGTTNPGLAVGAPLQVPGGGTFELYYVFPLTQEAQTLGLVQRTVAVAGVVLVVLIALVTWLVTRQVVTPVRLAARIAERLAAGRLEERLRVRGEDDLARLASSFNEMATSLQQQIRRLEELSRVQRRFVSDVSHELRTPLTTVRMAADVLYEAREAFDASTGRSAELLQAQLDRFESLLGDLLEISRFDAGAAVLEPESTDLRELAQSVLDACEPLAERRGSDLRLHTPATACVAEVDTRRIERVLRNLVVNAIEHGEGLPVEVTVAQGQGAVAIAVRDHGVGLKSGEAALVFNRFWRADPARSRTTGGTGLGLSIALEDAHLHGGWLQAWGEPGMGSQFRLTLPLRVGERIARSPLGLRPRDAQRRPQSRVVVASSGVTYGGSVDDDDEEPRRG
ncbi:MAG: MtrAB system histidine kinase MtrB [Actinomycetes bacterium]